MTGRRILVANRRRRAEGHRSNLREEGLLLTILLQSALCVVMLVFAFAAGQLCGMTEVKDCFSLMLSQETEAVEVFSVLRRAGESKSADQFREWIFDRIDKALGLGTQWLTGQGGEFANPEGKIPAGVMYVQPVLSAALFSPVCGAVTSPFGKRVHPISGKADFHMGVDLSAPHGTPVAAAYPGQVTKVGESKIYGNYVTLSHGGFSTRYCHCDRIAVSEGMRLRQGETIATVGSTGVSTGPHLHFELIFKGKNVDPCCEERKAVWNTVS